MRPPKNASDGLNPSSIANNNRGGLGATKRMALQWSLGNLARGGESVCALPSSFRVAYVKSCDGFLLQQAPLHRCQPPAACRDGTSACSQQLEALNECILSLAEHETSQPRGARAELIGTLRNQRIAVVGDSMARQAFATLVHLLRGRSVVIDPFTFGAMSYVQGQTSNGTTIDYLSLTGQRWGPSADPHVSQGGVPIDAMPRWVQAGRSLLDASVEWPFRSRLGSGILFESALRVDFYFTATCYGRQQLGSVWRHSGEELAKLLASGSYSHIVILPPNYWVLRGQSCECNSAKDKSMRDTATRQKQTMLCGRYTQCTGFPSRLSTRINASILLAAEAAAERANGSRLSPISAHWRCVANAKSNRTRAIVVSTPTERVPSNLLEGADGINARLAALFRSGQHGLTPANGWVHVDWAAATRVRKPVGTYGGNWHYACEMSPVDAWARPHMPEAFKVHVLDSEDCAEEGNTALWVEMLAPKMRGSGVWLSHLALEKFG